MKTMVSTKIDILYRVTEYGILSPSRFKHEHYCTSFEEAKQWIDTIGNGESKYIIVKLTREFFENLIDKNGSTVYN